MIDGTSPEAASSILSPTEPQAPAELESKAIELARLTREKGFGLLYGYLYSIHPNLPGWAPGEGFALGETLHEDRELGQKMISLIDMATNTIAVKGIYNGFDDDHRQWWISSRYSSTITESVQTMKLVEERGFLGRKVKRQIPELIQRTYNKSLTTPSGRQISGGPDWIHYTCQMPHIPPHDNRPGHHVRLDFVVPSDVASQIDQTVSANPLFADRFFQAVFPGIIGEDNKTHIKRKPATELAVVDNRDPKHKTVEVKLFPQPIPF